MTPEGWTKSSSSATNFKQRKALQPGALWDPTTHIASIASEIFKDSFERILKLHKVSQDHSCDHDWMQDFAVRTETKARVDCSEQSDRHAVPRRWNIANIEIVSIQCQTLWNLWFQGRASDVLLAQKFQTCWMIVAFFVSGLLIAQIVCIARECYFDENGVFFALIYNSVPSSIL